MLHTELTLTERAQAHSHQKRPELCQCFCNRKEGEARDGVREETEG